MQEIVAKDWVDPECYQYKNIKFEDNKITVGSWTDIYGKNMIVGKT